MREAEYAELDSEFLLCLSTDTGDERLEVLYDERDHIEVIRVSELVSEEGLEFLVMAFAEGLQEEAGLEVLINDELEGSGSLRENSAGAARAEGVNGPLQQRANVAEVLVAFGLLKAFVELALYFLVAVSH